MTLGRHATIQVELDAVKDEAGGRPRAGRDAVRQAVQEAIRVGDGIERVEVVEWCACTGEQLPLSSSNLKSIAIGQQRVSILRSRSLFRGYLLPVL